MKKATRKATTTTTTKKKRKESVKSSKKSKANLIAHADKKSRISKKRKVDAIIKHIGDEAVDEAAVETVDHFAQTKPSQITVGSIQSSFHASERKLHKRHGSGRFPIVAIGASAGGIESFTELLTHLSIDTGMAFVLIQHLAPHHDSLLPSIIARATEMPVCLAKTNLEIKPNHVYVIPPNVNMGIVNGLLKILPRIESPSQHMSIDFFFRCLADDLSHLAIGVILSGADGDGAQGLRAIRAQGGLALVQDPKTAKVDGMPRAAIAAGSTDSVLSVPGIAAELGRLSKHPLSQFMGAAEASPSDLAKIFAILRSKCGVDFSKYKLGTVNRRLRRRILLHKVADLHEYLEILKTDVAEVGELYDDLLINVTSFFRDTATFEYLRDKLFPKLIRRFSGNGHFRIWIPGCATGEEAYSLAILFNEVCDQMGRPIPLQIFASDISDRALAKARDAFYPDSIHLDVSAERLRRFFVKVPGGFRIASSIRESCVFARHDLLRDPPFSRMDIVSCRNLLIYLEPTQQKKSIHVFASSLNPRAYLILGSSETTGVVDSFELADKQARVYVRKSVVVRPVIEMPATLNTRHISQVKPASKQTDNGFELEREVNRVLLAKFSPAGVIVDRQMQIVQFRGSTGDYLEPAAGDASLNVFKMSRPGLDTELRMLIKKAEKSAKPVSREGITIKSSGRIRKITVECIPVRIQNDQVYYLILFFEPTAKLLFDGEERSVSGRNQKQRMAGDIKRVREELHATREHMQSIIREQDLTNEELQAANEEILSSNEELQSTNEELETAKEELQSANEELTTVNDELGDRNTQLLHANNDLNNLLGSVNLPIVMVGNDLRIRRYTPMGERVLNVIPSDIGRPITDIQPNIEVPDLEALILNTIDSMQTFERDVQDKSGHWYSLRIRPYKTDENKIDGAVILLVDVGLRHKKESVKFEERSSIDSLNSVDQPVFFLQSNFTVSYVNESFARTFQLKSEDVVGKKFFEIENGVWSQPMLKALFNDVIQKNTKLTDYKVSREFIDLGSLTFLVNARKVQRSGKIEILVMLDDVSPDDEDIR